MSDQPGSLAAALAELQTQLPHVTKDATNPHFKSRYATLDAISAALLPLMGKLGLAWICCPRLLGGYQDGPPAFGLAYELRHVSGEAITGDYPLPNGSPQAIGSAITYARRYALCAVTGLAPDEDDDGNAAENSQKPVKPASAARASQKTPAQQRAAGAPTGTPTQQREQRARRAEEERARAPLPSPRPADRSNNPRDDIWADRPEERPGSIQRGQARAIEALLTKAGTPAGDRDARHAEIGVLLGLDDAIGSMNDLSFAQAAEAIKALSALTGDAKMPSPARDARERARDHADAAANDDLWEGMNVQ